MSQILNIPEGKEAVWLNLFASPFTFGEFYASSYAEQRAAGYVIGVWFPNAWEATDTSVSALTSQAEWDYWKQIPDADPRREYFRIPLSAARNASLPISAAL